MNTYGHYRTEVSRRRPGEVRVQVEVPLYVACDQSGALSFARDEGFPHPAPERVTRAIARFSEVWQIGAELAGECPYRHREFRLTKITVALDVAESLWPPTTKVTLAIEQQAERAALDFLAAKGQLTCEACASHEFGRAGKRLKCRECGHVPQT